MSDPMASETLLRRNFPIAAIGAGDGGVEAILELIQALPARSRLAIVVQCIDTNGNGSHSEILRQHRSMKMVEAADGMSIEPGIIYVIPYDVRMVVERGVFNAQPLNPILGPAMLIDDLFDSLGKDQGAEAIGIICSGTGSDGALGLQSIKENGGITFAQDEQSARYAGMPLAAIELKSGDLVLPPVQIAKELVRLTEHWYDEAGGEEGDAQRQDEESMKRIFRHVRSVCNVDFSHYKRGTVERRLKRRLALHDLGTMSAYSSVLETDPTEAHALCRDLLIKFTEFFRDTDVFEALEETIFPRIVQGPDNAPIRVWVPGCATGEEVYSIAITLTEYLARNNITRSIQIFGTDVSEEALDTARAGRYIENIARNVSPVRLQKFFIKEGDRYRVVKIIRDCCTFARQNVAYDPPFSRIDLLSCRNLLIYLDPTLQKRVMPSFHFALQRDGVLMLGLSETVGAYSDLFSAIETKRGKFFAKRPVHSRPFVSFGPVHTAGGQQVSARASSSGPQEAGVDQLRSEADRVVIARYTPPSVLCDEGFNILEFRGDTSLFLTNPPGAPTSDLQRLARPGVFLAISSAMRQVATDGAAVRKTGLRIETAGGGNVKLPSRLCPCKTPAPRVAGSWSCSRKSSIPSSRHPSERMYRLDRNSRPRWRSGFPEERRGVAMKRRRGRLSASSKKSMQRAIKFV